MKSFREALCEYYGCPPQDFSRKMFFFCAVEKNKFLLKIAWLFQPTAVVESLKLIDDIADAKSISNLEDAFFDYRHSLHDLGLSHSRYRISTNSIIEVFKIVQGMEVL